MANEVYELIPKTRKGFDVVENNDGSKHTPQLKTTAKRTSSYGGRVWSWIASLFEDKPYEVRESWGGTVWQLSKRLLTLSILVG